MGLAGAGKTTMMRALNGCTRPTSGRVLFNGEDLYANQDQFRHQVGYIPRMTFSTRNSLCERLSSIPLDSEPT